MTIATTELLTDEMLARFDERAPSTTGRTASSTRTSRSCATSGYLLVRRADRVRRRRARPRRVLPSCSGGWPTSRRRPRWPSTCTATGRASPPTWCGWATTRAGGSSSEAADGRGVRRAPRRGRQRPAAAAGRRATPSGSTAAGRSRGHKIFGSLTPVWTYGGFHAMDTSDPEQPADRARLPAAVTPRASRSSTRGTRSACGPRRARTRPRQGVRARRARRRWCARPGSPAPGRSRSAIFAWALLGFAAVYLGAAQRAFDMTVEPHAAAHVDRADQLDGAPPRGAARGGRDAHRLRRRRGAARAHVRRLGGRRRARGLAGAPGRPPVSS